VRQVLRRSGTLQEKAWAARIEPVRSPSARTRGPGLQRPAVAQPPGRARPGVAGPGPGLQRLRRRGRARSRAPRVHPPSWCADVFRGHTLPCARRAGGAQPALPARHPRPVQRRLHGGARPQRRARRRAAAVTCAQLAAPRGTPPAGGAAERPAAALTAPPGAQTLPLVLDRLADPITAVLLSITVVLIFGAPPRPCPGFSCRPRFSHQAEQRRRRAASLS